MPLLVADVPAAAAFYRDRLGLDQVDGWSRGGETGAVFAVGDARIEVVAGAAPGGFPARPSPAAFAIELPAWADVDALAARLAPGRSARVLPRGHYAVILTDPDGNEVLMWSEAT
jgi:catechol 2,3-dioxygenase-like lactoylglutathione lyase family enzyme